MGTGTWGFVHLSVHKGDLGCLVLQGNDTSFNHLIVQIVTLTGSFSYSSKYRVTSVGFGNIVNQFHNQDSFADTGTTEKSNFTPLSIRGQQVHNFDASFQNFLVDTHFNKFRSFSVDWGN